MNKYLTLIIIFFCSYFVNGQNDYATINIYRPKMMYGSATKDYVVINGVKVCYLKNGGHLEYKVFANDNLIIQVYATALGTTSDIISKYNVTVQKGASYYFKLKPKFGRIEMEQINSPVPQNKLKSNRFISLSDIQFKPNEIVYKHPKTNWTKQKLIEYWNKKGANDIEGIYEKVGTFLEYELAVLKENNEYKIIYLSGAKGSSWNEGDLKSILQKTARFGVFKAKWFMLNKYLNDDIIITFDDFRMKVSLESGKDDDIYLKVYPTYDENNRNEKEVKSEWKSTGTGFFIDKKGYLATNHHVIENANSIEITYNKQNYKAKVVISDEQNDLAILKITDVKFNSLNSIDYNFETKTSSVGKSVFTLGFPETQLMGNEIKLTNGIINSKTGFKGSISEYQISAQIQHGNSGGPLFDNNGNLLGITSSGLRGKEIENVNYAIKTKYLNLLVDELENEIQLPNSKLNANTPLEQKYEILKKYVVFIKVK